MTTALSPDPAGGPEWVSARPPRIVEVLGRVFRFPALMAKYHDLVWTSARRDLEARFTGTVLGWFWPLVYPVFLFAVYYFIFTKLLDMKIPELPPGQESAMGIFMFTGIMVWTAFAEALGRGTSVIVDSGNLIKKLAFPSEILPLNVTLVSTVTMLFGVTIFVLACTLTPIWPAPGLSLAWVPLILLLQLAFTYGLTLFLSALQVFLRDTNQIVGIFMTIWMFVTPLFWVPELMGRSVEPYTPLIRTNPVYHLVYAWRGALMGDLDVFVARRGEVTSIVSEAAVGAHLLTFLPWAAVAFVGGYSFFILSQRRFADEV